MLLFIVKVKLNYMFEKPNLESEESPFMRREDFDRQLSEVRTLETENGNIDYVSIEPEKITHETPIVYIGGFSQGANTYADEMYDLVKDGRRLMFTNPIRGIEMSGDNSDPLTETQKNFDLPDVVINKVRAVETLIKNQQMDSGKVDLVGHSQGGMIASILSSANPNLVNNLILENPMGFQGEISTPAIVTKFAYQMVGQMVDIGKQLAHGDKRPISVASKMSKSFTKEFLKDTIWRLTEEVPGATQVDLMPILKKIKSDMSDEEDGVKITLINAANDKLFTPEMYEGRLHEESENLEQEDPPENFKGPFEYVDAWIMYARKGATHNAAGIEKSGLLKQILNN